jgi:FtsP/CotA-like multicopper oxidase with cupredoxin domain
MNRSASLVTLAVIASLSPSAIAAGAVGATPFCRFRGGAALAALPARADAANPGCARPAAGAETAAPIDLYSRDGVLKVRLDYRSSRDRDGRTLFCFVTPDGIESPTLHVKPGDTLDIILTNRTREPRPPEAAAGAMIMGLGSTVCGAATADAASVNLHFHGVSVPADCHGDDVIHTSVNAGESFTYHMVIPRDQPPGLYWYHPHIHGLAEAAALGGASGAIVVDGIETLQPIVGGLPQRMLVIRDQIVAGRPRPGGAVPSWDLSLNYVPIAYPALTPAVIRFQAGRREFWRVLNASADTVADLRLRYDGVDQPLSLVALDGVPTGSDHGRRTGRPVTVTHVQIPAAGRAEFVITAPTAAVKQATLETAAIDTGPDGDHETARTLARLASRGAGHAADGLMTRPVPVSAIRPSTPDVESLDDALVTRRRRLFFSEQGSDDVAAGAPTQFFITVVGDTPAVYNPLAPPAIVTTEGAVEVWTVENRTRETHEFHIHQVHFELVRRNGEIVPRDERQDLDTVQIPYWRGFGPYPSVTVLVDFRGAAPGDILYHCHILQHEDAGMMAMIRILPRRPGPLAAAARPGPRVGA